MVTENMACRLYGIGRPTKCASSTRTGYGLEASLLANSTFSSGISLAAPMASPARKAAPTVLPSGQADGRTRLILSRSACQVFTIMGSCRPPMMGYASPYQSIRKTTTAAGDSSVSPALTAACTLS